MAEGTTKLSNLLPQSSVVLHELIGEGGYSKVWRATYTNKLKREVPAAAKKVLSCSLDDKEICNMQQMNHENIVKFYGVWKNGDDVYIIMDLAENGDLRNFLAKCKKEHTRPTIECILKWTYQAACALQYLKRLQLSHRDIKSLNFLLSKDYTLKLGDLGLATQLYETQQTQRRGTTPWMAPEVYSDALRSPKSDIFSLAMVMWEIITADIPYAECKGDFEVMKAVVDGERPVVPDYCPEILTTLLTSCWDGDRKKRPDIDEVCQELLQYQCPVTIYVEPVSSELESSSECTTDGVTATTSAGPDDSSTKPTGPNSSLNVKQLQQGIKDVESGSGKVCYSEAGHKKKATKPTSVKHHLHGIPKSEAYKMERHPHGLCVIINNMKFNGTSKKVKYPDRKGSEIDADNLKDLFEHLNYKVEIHENLKAAEMFDLLDSKRQMDHSQSDSFVCCILTHGHNAEVCGSDAEPLSILQLTALFKANVCPSLAGKPKFFVFQACQGENTQGCVEVEYDGLVQKESIPDEADFVLGYATVPKHLAYRHTKEGSWYINAFVDTIKKAYRDHDLLNLLGMVNKRMSEFTTAGGHKQTSSVFSTLRKYLYLSDRQDQAKSAGASLKQFSTV